MLKLQFLIACLFLSSLSNAATIGVFADAAGTTFTSFGNYNSDGTVEVDGYVIVEADDLVNAVGFRVDVNGEGTTAFRIASWFGPTGDGLLVDTDNGESIGLGGCFPGFNSMKIVVAHYRYILLHGWPNGGTSTAPAHLGRGPTASRFMTLYANPDSDPGNPDAQLFPIYSDCRGGIIPLVVTNELWSYGPLATESHSFGAVKALAMPAN